MSNELSQLDELIESDILEALGKNNEGEEVTTTNLDNSDEILIEDFTEDIDTTEEGLENTKTVDEETQDFNEPVIEDIIEETAPENLETSESSSSITLDKEINSTSLAKLLSDLLNNKTIEITIKIKD